MDKVEAGCLGFIIGIVFLAILLTPYNLKAKDVAEQICEFLDNDLIDYDYSYGKFDYIKCGDKKLIEGLDAEKLIEIMG